MFIFCIITFAGLAISGAAIAFLCIPDFGPNHLAHMLNPWRK